MFLRITLPAIAHCCTLQARYCVQFYTYRAVDRNTMYTIKLWLVAALASHQQRTWVPWLTLHQYQPVARCRILAAAAAAAAACICCWCCCALLGSSCSIVSADGPARGCDDARTVLCTHQQALARLCDSLQHQTANTNMHRQPYLVHAEHVKS
jgi:hypothetical protein